MKRLIIALSFVFSLVSCGDIDNYEEPSAIIEGGVYDKSTQELIPAQAPNGAKIRLYEDNSTQPIDFWCNTDGSFTNTRVFAARYSIVPEGPFIVNNSDTIKTVIPTNEKIAFYVEPFLRVKCTATLNGDKADIKYTITKSVAWDGTLNQYAVLYSWTKNVDINNYSSRHQVSVNAADEADLLGKEQTYVIEKIDTSRPVFVRVAARTSGTNFYNYSPVIQLK